MGVLGLWQILESVGHPIKLDGLEGKRLGVDANVWLYKFIRGFREKDNATSIESHKLGLFNRICKLLFYKIKPIFVFDGPAPVLKRRTLERRQNIRNKQLAKVQDAAVRLIAEQLKEQYPDAKIDDLKIQLPELRSHNLVAAEKLTDEDLELFYLPPEQKNDDDTDGSDDDNEGDQDNLMPAEAQAPVDVDSEDFNSLPAEVRYEILTDIKESRRRVKRSHELPENAKEFSSFQLQRLQAKRKIQEKIEKCEKEICSMYTGQSELCKSYRVQSDATATMLYMQKSTPKLEQTTSVSQESGVETQNTVISTSVYPPKAEDEQQESRVNKAKLKPLFDMPSQSPSSKGTINIRAGVKDNVTMNEERVSMNSPTFSEPSSDETEVEEQSDDPEVAQHESLEPDVLLITPPRHNATLESLESDLPLITTPRQNATITIESSPASTPSPQRTILIETENDEPDDAPTIIAEMKEPKNGADVPKVHHEQPKIIMIDDDKEKIQNIRIETENGEQDDVPTISAETEKPRVSADVPNDHSEQPKIIINELDIESDELDDAATVRAKVREPRVSADVPKDHDEQPKIIMNDPNIEKIRNILSEQTRTTNKVTTKIVEEAKELLRLFGIPYIDASGEAEAQCALLEKLKLTEGTITDDSDVWLFGAQHVYRYFFSDDKYVMQYKMSEIEYHIRMNLENLVCFAMLVGSDYTDGIMNVGPVTALEILSEFPGEGLDPLIKFKNWMDKCKRSKDRVPGNKKRESFLKFKLPEEFPSRAVFEGYLRPLADTSTEAFSWGTPELDELREYARRNFAWDMKKIDEKLLPVMKKLSERRTQTTIDSYFFKTAANQNPELFRSKRVNEALNKISKTTELELEDDEVVLTEDEDQVDNEAGTSKGKKQQQQPPVRMRNKKKKPTKGSTKRQRGAR